LFRAAQYPAWPWTQQGFGRPIRYWRPGQPGGLAVAEVPTEHIASLGGLKQQRVRGAINGTEYTSSVMPAGGGRLGLSVSKTMLRTGGVKVGDAADFEIKLAAAATELS
jgi:hypothetical protein